MPLDAGRPLLITDADEVLLRFAAGFDRFLRQREHYLDLVSYRLHGNVKRIAGGEAILDIEATALLVEAVDHPTQPALFGDHVVALLH